VRPGVTLTAHPHLEIALMMEEVRVSETSICIGETTQRHTSEGCHLHAHRRENLKFQFVHGFYSIVSNSGFYVE
jgi:hypothetical protein